MKYRPKRTILDDILEMTKAGKICKVTLKGGQVEVGRMKFFGAIEDPEDEDRDVDCLVFEDQQGHLTEYVADDIESVKAYIESQGTE